VREVLERELILAMAAAASARMRWGMDDCALWAANVIQAALGYDPAAKFRGHYRTRRGARRVLGGPGLPGALRAAARRHQWVRVDPADARVGDIGLMAVDGASCCVVCRTRGWFVGRTDEGFAAVKSGMIRIAWSVGSAV